MASLIRRFVAFARQICVVRFFRLKPTLQSMKGSLIHKNSLHNKFIKSLGVIRFFNWFCCNGLTWLIYKIGLQFGCLRKKWIPIRCTPKLHIRYGFIDLYFILYPARYFTQIIIQNNKCLKLFHFYSICTYPTFCYISVFSKMQRLF